MISDSKFIRLWLLTMLCIGCFFNHCLAIGWQELSENEIKDRGISVDWKFNADYECNDFKITLPSILFFEQLGDRNFVSASYKKVSNKIKGWQLNSKGTQIYLPYFNDNNNIHLKNICLGHQDLKNAYISLYYQGPEGTPPMIVLLNLSEYMRIQSIEKLDAQ